MFKKFLLISIVLFVIVYVGINLIVFLRVNHLMSAVNNYSMCDIAYARRCIEYVNRSDKEIETEFSRLKNDFSVIAAIKIYNKEKESSFQGLQNIKDITVEEKKELDNIIKKKEYHEKIMKVVNENIDFDRMDFLDKKVYKSLLKK